MYFLYEPDHVQMAFSNTESKKKKQRQNKSTQPENSGNNIFKAGLIFYSISVIWTMILVNCIFIYRKFPKYSDTQKICCNHSKIWIMWLYNRVMSPNDAAGMANSVDPDQTAHLGLHCLPCHICPKT